LALGKKFNQKIENIPDSVLVICVSNIHDLKIHSKCNIIYCYNENVFAIEKLDNNSICMAKNSMLLDEINYIPNIGIEYFKSKNEFQQSFKKMNDVYHHGKYK